ncbi:MAG TPA: MMPL family transporter, partial [Polyangiaceae bacterium]|nr:MMPL family transporter [Polyangiaceae bacterium]
GLGFRADFSELLPDNKDSVVEMRRVSERLAGASTLTVVAQIEQGRDAAALERFVDELVPRLAKLGPQWVGAIDYGVQDSRKFFEQKKLLFADVEALRAVHHDVMARYDYEVAKASDSLIDDTEPAQVTAESIKARLGAGTDKDKQNPTDAYPNGYYENREGSLIAVLVRTPVSGKARVEELKRKVAEVVASVKPAAFHPSMRVRYTGDLITSAEEYDAIVTDLSHVGIWGVVGVLVTVLLFFLRVRTVMIIGATMLIGLVWSFGLTRFTIGYLNSSSGFLVSIIAGNGINYGIMYMARYVEARRDQGIGVGEAILVAHRDSWIPTLASAATAMLAYGSLIATDFRGFKHFGIIGSYGMMLCWTTTYLFMPALLAASERVLPSFKGAGSAKRSRARGYYGVLFAKLAMAAPRSITAFGFVVGIGTLALSYEYLAKDPIEYDMTKVRNERKDRTDAGELSGAVDEVIGRVGQDGMAIMTDRIDQVPLLQAALSKRLEAAPADQKPFENVVTIFSLLPSDQEVKIPLINEMRDRLMRAKSRGFLNEAQWNDLKPHVPTEALRPVGIADLPEQVARAFTEKDGTRGRIVYIVPKYGFSVWDAKYLMRWADSFRRTELPGGDVIKGSGRAVIFADMIKTIGEDAPKAIAISALGSILIIAIAFRGHRHSWGVFIPWLIGITSLVAFLRLTDAKLNFLNFVAVPITIGIGAEYAHNLMQRYRIEGRSRLYHVVAETGGAVVLCSLTTTIGYLALLLSINKGIVSFGLAAAVGEMTCLVAAVLILPAFLAWRGGDRREKVERGESRGRAA